MGLFYFIYLFMNTWLFGGTQKLSECTFHPSFDITSSPSFFLVLFLGGFGGKVALFYVTTCKAIRCYASLPSGCVFFSLVSN